MRLPRISSTTLVLALLALVVRLVDHSPIAAAAEDPSGPLTVAEQSDYKSTAHSSEVVQFIDTIAAKADHVRRVDFGITHEGRPMVAAVVAQPTVSDPAQLQDDPRTVVLVLGNIHSGECAGKEALLMLLRELGDKPDHPWLKNLVLVFVPNYNADGNDRMNADNRPGQVGPENGMGERQNGQGLDLNRDFTKLDAPETRALITLIKKWDPHLFIDTHTTNGSQHRYALTYDVPHNPASPEAVQQFMRREMMPDVTRHLQEINIDTFYYGNFNRDHTRWSTFGDFPRYGTEYVGLRGRLSILAEAYAYITYRERIVAIREFVRACLDFTASRHAPIRQLLAEVRNQAVTAGRQAAHGDLVPVQSEMTAMEDQVAVKGYKMPLGSRSRRATATDPEDYTVDYFALYRPTLQVQRPFAYLLPAEFSPIAGRLRMHGVQVERLSEDVTLDVEGYKITALERSQRTYQGHQLTKVSVEPFQDQRPIPAGSLVVHTGQQLSNLITVLLEPSSSDGFAAWNLFAPELTADGHYPVLRIPSPVQLPVTRLLIDAPPPALPQIRIERIRQ